MYPKGNLYIPASHGRLEAILKEPPGERRGIALVCHPHPLGGGTMHNKVVFRAAAGLVNAARFNFRGVGDSTGTHDEIAGGRKDVRDALDYITSSTRTSIDACRIFIRLAHRSRSRLERRTRRPPHLDRYAGR